MLTAEKAVLDQLYETSSERQRLLQALLTNLTLLRKCAKERGDEEEVRKLTAARSDLRHQEKTEASATSVKRHSNHGTTRALQQEALHCRLVARQFALAKIADRARSLNELESLLNHLADEVERSPVCSMQRAAVEFYQIITFALSKGDDTKQTNAAVLKACDCLRDRLREHGVTVNDTIQPQTPPNNK